jgi:hypothetical protein
VRLPWAVSFRTKAPDLLSDVRLSDGTFEPSSAAPAVLALRVGRADSAADGETIEPVAVLSGELRTESGRSIGTLFTLRDLLPGRYAFGLTGRGPDGTRLAAGKYVLRLVAEPVPGDDGARDSAVDVRFTISSEGG